MRGAAGCYRQILSLCVLLRRCFFICRFSFIACLHTNPALSPKREAEARDFFARGLRMYTSSKEGGGGARVFCLGCLFSPSTTAPQNHRPVLPFLSPFIAMSCTPSFAAGDLVRVQESTGPYVHGRDVERYIDRQGLQKTRRLVFLPTSCV